jgi:hypothetical protein
VITRVGGVVAGTVVAGTVEAGRVTRVVGGRVVAVVVVAFGRGVVVVTAGASATVVVDVDVEVAATGTLTSVAVLPPHAATMVTAARHPNNQPLLCRAVVMPVTTAERGPGILRKTGHNGPWCGA